jgi:hypothetical protein
MKIGLASNFEIFVKVLNFDKDYQHLGYYNLVLGQLLCVRDYSGALFIFGDFFAKYKKAGT